MMWELARLEDIVELNPRVGVDRTASYPFVDMAAIDPNRRYVEATEIRTPATGSRFLDGDTLFARITPCLENGKIAQYRGEPGSIALGSTEFWVLRARPGISDPGFVYYLATTSAIRGPAEASMVGASGRQRADLSVMRGLSVLVPDLATQQRVAGALGSLDDLVDVNNRRIEALEELVRLLYGEWFLSLRFPMDGSHGERPELEALTVGAISSYVNRGISPRYDPESVSTVINQRCIRDHRLSLEHARTHASSVPVDKMVRYGDVLVNSTGVGTLGRVAQVYEHLADHTVDSHVTIVRPSPEVDPDWFGLALEQLESYFERHGAGATGQTELARSRVAEAPIPVPAAALQKEFGRVVRPFRELSARLAAQNTSLRATRALLLPKLMAGEVSVDRQAQEWQEAS